MPSGPVSRTRFTVTGTVQGVGFRPFVYREALALELDGFVRNDSVGVVIELQGPPGRIDEFARRLVQHPPPLARVDGVRTETLAPRHSREPFRILTSDSTGTPTAPVSVDTATCEDCLAEVDDPSDRRYRYPFINCTNCGPRYTIVLSIPYDRPATTMASFVMCEECRREYEDPTDRRFHAQPNACAACGPQLTWIVPGEGPSATGPDALEAAVAALGNGAVVAVKGLGGYHLAVNATDAEAVARLRRRKARDDKPFAVMVADVDAARDLCTLDDAAVAALGSTRRPIVLSPRASRPIVSLAGGVAPGLPELGLLLPYSAMHHLLIRSVGAPLVMTSGNLSDDPIAYDDDDALARLGPLVDGFLTHNRPIYIRCDDSVVRSTRRGTQVLRRSRGFAPEPLPLPTPASRQILAVGAELKSTISVARDGFVVASHHLGDLEHLATYQSFLQALDHLGHLYGVEPDVVVHDLHPEYLSTKLALELDLPTLGVQHHHAHLASCMVDHRRTEPVLGMAFDGIGYGDDGTLWGGEFMVADLHHYERVGHLRAVALPGGTAAIRNPWRMALAWATAAGEGDRALPEDSSIDDVERRAVGSLLGSDRAAATTSMGRLFDAAAAMLGVRETVAYEGQAAIELEALALSATTATKSVFASTDGLLAGLKVGRPGRVVELDPRDLVRSLLDARDDGAPTAVVAAAFHEIVARDSAALAIELAGEHGLDTIALSGGVFQNVLLTDLVCDAVTAAGLSPLVHRVVPPNDGGISIGQAAIAAAG